MGAVAKPMIWLYLRTGSPSAIGTTATLCPRGTLARTTSAPAESPSCRSRIATRTLSSWCSCTPRRSWGGTTLIGSSRLNRCGRRSSVPGGQLPVLVEAQGRRRTGDLQVRPVLDLAAEELGDQQVLQARVLRRRTRVTRSRSPVDGHDRAVDGSRRPVSPPSTVSAVPVVAPATGLARY